MKSVPKSATEDAIETIARADTMRADALVSMNRKLDAFIMLLERAEQRAAVTGDDGRIKSFATDRLEFARADRALIRTDIQDVCIRMETNRREIMDYIRHNAPLATRLWNWLGEVFDARRGREMRGER